MARPAPERLARSRPDVVPVDGVRVPRKEMKQYEARLQRSATLPKYDITIKPMAESVVM